MSRSCGRHIETLCQNKGVRARDPEIPTWLSPSLPLPNHPDSSLPPGASSHPVALFLTRYRLFPALWSYIPGEYFPLSLRVSFSATSESSPFPPVVACLFTNSFHQKNVFLAFLQSPSGHSFTHLTNIYLEFIGLLGKKYCTRQRCG